MTILELLPGGRIPWLLVAGDDSLQILSEVRIDRNRGVAFLRLPEDLRDRPPASVRRTDDSHGTMVLLHDHLDAFLDLRQHAMDIAGKFGLRNTDCRTCPRYPWRAGAGPG